MRADIFLFAAITFLASFCAADEEDAADFKGLPVSREIAWQAGQKVSFEVKYRPAFFAYRKYLPVNWLTFEMKKDKPLWPDEKFEFASYEVSPSDAEGWYKVQATLLPNLPAGRYFIKAQLFDAKDWLESDRFFIKQSDPNAPVADKENVAPATNKEIVVPQVIAGVGGL